MSTSQLVAQHLPFLRRYGRALSGTQTAGDAYVTAMLETLIADPQALDPDLDPRVGLYKLLTNLWNSVSINSEVDPGPAPAKAEERLGHITPLVRQAFLLVSLEGFDEEDAAEILDISVARLRSLVEEAGRELASEIATEVLIIEDEPFIALDLEGLVESLGHRVTGIARTHAEAVSLAKRKTPGLVLADIQLADGSSGLDAVNELIERVEVPVIFITAYPERFLTGVRPEPAFLIAKPFQPATVAAVISQALFFERKARPREQRATA